jgi:predicted RNase H-like nuclease (RuvC/YqgF family)
MSKGVDSIRIKGRKIQELPLGQGNEAKAQLPMAIEDERLAAIETVNAEYPTHRIDYLLSRIKECEENKDRMQTTTDQLNTMTSEYNGQIKMCEHRDREIEKLQKASDSSPSQVEAGVKELKRKYPPYDIAAMEQQIVQNGEGIERCKQVVIAEDASIKEFTEVLTLCRQRDKALAKLGAVAEGS